MLAAQTLNHRSEHAATQQLHPAADTSPHGAAVETPSNENVVLLLLTQHLLSSAAAAAAPDEHPFRITATCQQHNYCRS
jgi:hypothetical protein